MPFATRPQPDEFAPYYAGYIAAVPQGDVRDALRDEQMALRALLADLSDAEQRHRYAPGKWSVREVIGHCSDTERIFAYRALRIARGDTTSLPGFDQDMFVVNGGFDDRSIRDLLAEFDAVRAATLALLDSFDADTLVRQGRASTVPVSVRALAWMTAGHVRHHRLLLADRYLGRPDGAAADRPSPAATR